MLVSVASGKNANVYPTIGTNGAVEKIGAGTVTLLGPNNASPFRVSAGTVVIGVSWDGLYKGSLTSGTVDLAGGTLKFNRSDSISFGLPVSGTASLEQAGSGVLTLTSTSSTHTGPVNVTAGTLFMDGSLASSTSPLTVSSGATLSVVFEAHELNVLTDPHHLRTILTNLLSNAIKYSSRGLVRITATSPAPQSVVITVADNGIGIPTDDLNKIFEPFVRLPYRKDSVDGIGLGLAIVKQTADLIKAPIQVESLVGQGTTFFLTLPRSQDLQAVVAPAKDTYLRGLRIVVVDNDEIVLESMARTLEEWGCRVIAACDWVGLEAKLEMTSSPIDLILTDFHLDAGLSGYELIKRVRKRAGAQIPSILLTGDVEIRHGPESTATAVVIAYKPLPYEKLANLIQETISSFGAQASGNAP